PGGRPEGFGIEFARAGTRSYLAPLWPVYDNFAADLAQRVYAALVTGYGFGDALLRVRRELRQERPWDPTWAAYVLYGHPSEPLFVSLPASLAAPAAGLNPSERGGQRQQGAAGRSSLGPLVPGTLRGAESSAVYRRLAVEIERHWFVGEPARLAD